MTKHIAGLILFTFIIGTSAAIAGLFDYGSHRSKSITVRKSYHTYKRKKRCRKRRKPKRPHFTESRIAPVQLTQAVLDRSTGLLTTTHRIDPRQNRGRNTALLYHFYSNGENGPQYLKTERLNRWNTVNEFHWLADRESSETIYIIPGYSSNHRSSVVAPRFELSKAVPVLIKEVE